MVADFVLKDPKSVITMKTAEASSAMGISEPTLIRFCKALGFSGYQEFKINLSQQLAADDYFVMYEIEEDDSIHDLCEKVFDTTISEILNVRSQIDQDVLGVGRSDIGEAHFAQAFAVFFQGLEFVGKPLELDPVSQFVRVLVARAHPFVAAEVSPGLQYSKRFTEERVFVRRLRNRAR